jgi:hypothetical protein
MGYEARFCKGGSPPAMKRPRFMPVLSFCLGLSLVGVLPGYSQASEETISLNVAKPYVYLEFDHVGSRSPLRAGEPNRGIWFRLKNNSRFAVTVIASTDSAWVGDEVVPDVPSPGTESLGDAIGYKPGQEDFTDIYLFPNQTEAEVRGAESTSNGRDGGKVKADNLRRPQGYSGGHQPGPQVLKVIPSGGEVLFSLPIDHVRPSWHLEIPFRFALKHEGSARPPYSYVAFFWDDLPDAYRTGSTESPASKPTSSASTLLHESGHTDPPKQH